MLTLFIIGITCLTSYLAFNDPALKYKLVFYPYDIQNNNTYYRFISSVFIHADYTHLLFNMITLFFFGRLVEQYFGLYFGSMGSILYLLLYFSGKIASSSVSFIKHKDNVGYSALGASGAVSAVLFVAIVFDPWMSMFIFPIPFPIPAILVGIGYLVYSHWAAQNARDNIGHDAHFFGAVYGVLFIFAFRYQTAIEFVNQLFGIQIGL